MHTSKLVIKIFSPTSRHTFIRRHKYDQDEVRSIFSFILAAICNDYHLLLSANRKRVPTRKRSKKNAQDVINPSSAAQLQIHNGGTISSSERKVA